MRLLISLTIFFLAFTPSLSQAELHYYRTSTEKTDSQNKQLINHQSERGTLIITSINKCYKDLDKKDVLEIKKKYIKPYKECIRRRDAKKKKDNIIKITPKVENKIKDKKINNFNFNK